MKKKYIKNKKNEYEKTEPTRIIKKQKTMILSLGDGDFTKGLSKLLSEHEILLRNPQIILQKEFEFYMDLMKTIAPENHYKDFVESGLPTIHYLFHKTGKVDIRHLRKRIELPIDKFENKQGVDDAEVIG